MQKPWLPRATFCWMPGPYALQEALEEASGASMPPAPKSGLGIGKEVTGSITRHFLKTHKSQ